MDRWRWTEGATEHQVKAAGPVCRRLRWQSFLEVNYPPFKAARTPAEREREQKPITADKLGFFLSPSSSHSLNDPALPSVGVASEGCAGCPNTHDNRLVLFRLRMSAVAERAADSKLSPGSREMVLGKCVSPSLPPDLQISFCLLSGSPHRHPHTHPGPWASLPCPTWAQFSVTSASSATSSPGLVFNPAPPRDCLPKQALSGFSGAFPTQRLS